MEKYWPARRNAAEMPPRAVWGNNMTRQMTTGSHSCSHNTQSAAASEPRSVLGRRLPSRFALGAPAAAAEEEDSANSITRQTLLTWMVPACANTAMTITRIIQVRVCASACMRCTINCCRRSLFSIPGAALDGKPTK